MIDGKSLTTIVSINTDTQLESVTVSVTIREVFPEPSVEVVNVCEGFLLVELAPVVPKFQEKFAPELANRVESENETVVPEQIVSFDNPNLAFKFSILMVTESLIIPDE